MEFCGCRYDLRFLHPSRVATKRARSERMVGDPEVIWPRHDKFGTGKSAWAEQIRQAWSFSVLTRPNCRHSSLQITRKRKRLIGRQSTQNALRCLLIRMGK